MAEDLRSIGECAVPQPLPLTLGADLAATAKPALSAASDPDDTEAIITGLQAYIDELRIAMFCSGCGNLGALRSLALERL